MLLTLYMLRKRYDYVGTLIKVLTRPANMKAVRSFETSLYDNPRDAV